MNKENRTSNDILKGYSMLLYFSGSFILNQPLESCIYEIAGSNILKKMPVESSNPGFTMASAYLNQINSNTPVDFESILDDHLKLFGGMGTPKAPPYESVYLSEEHLMNQKQTLEVKRTYATYGWESQLTGKVPEDHLGIELQFLNLMLEKFMEIDDDACHREVAADIRRFTDTHLTPWLPDWNRDMQKNAKSNFYKGIGHLIVSCVEDIRSLV
jgi:TorA maturation chaperone TorD